MSKEKSKDQIYLSKNAIILKNHQLRCKRDLSETRFFE